jgi:2-oxoglutarate ferredoxin oxidoreductase subunit beta
MSEAVKLKLSKKDLESDQDVRWCPGCGDYAILATVQRTLAQLGVKRENTVFISGIGCSSRFPYYMNTYGFHTIHGRAPTIASGLKVTRPELDVWVITGDGDGLSIGGNHMIHVLRRNMDLKIILFNNQIYGLTKGQYSPTSAMGTRAPSTPSGSIDHPLNPISLALGVGATFVARAADTDAKLMGKILEEAYKHKGAVFIEMLQNCPVFNDGVWESVKDDPANKQILLQ